MPRVIVVRFWSVNGQNSVIFTEDGGKGMEAGEELWANPLFTLYPEIGANHMRKYK
ncbi:hypothetical protein ACFLV5_01470 [Chloroflexota bacterium]